MKKYFFAFAVLFFVVFTTTGHAQTSCTQTLSPGANIASAVSGAGSGATICLNNGSYGSVNLANISKSSYVTIRSVNSKGATLGYVDIGNTDYIRFEDVIIGGAIISDCSQHVQMTNSTFTKGLSIRADDCTPSNNLDYTISGNTFNNLPASMWEGRLSIGLVGGSSGIKISNNIFGGGGCSDGVQLVGGTGGVTIGPGNIFRDLVQGSCGEHVDAIQTYGAGPGNVIVGNYFINNTMHIGIYDGGTDYTITNNVFDAPNDPGHTPIQLGGISGMLIEHNTIANGVLFDGGSKSGQQNTGWVVQNNIFDDSHFTESGSDGCGTNCIMRYNLKSRGGTTNPTGTNNITGDAVWIGSGSVNNWANWRLASGSPGKSAGNDGADMGINYYGGAVGPTPTPTYSPTPTPTSTPSPTPVPSAKFTINDRIYVADGPSNVRQTPAGTLLGSQANNSLGTVKQGPTAALFNNVTVNWWYIDFDSGVDGWVGEDTLEKSGSTATQKGDLNADNKVDVTDLGIFLSNWGKTTKPASDINQDGHVDVTDLGILLSNWG